MRFKDYYLKENLRVKPETWQGTNKEVMNLLKKQGSFNKCFIELDIDDHLEQIGADYKFKFGVNSPFFVDDKIANIYKFKDRLRESFVKADLIAPDQDIGDIHMDEFVEVNFEAIWKPRDNNAVEIINHSNRPVNKSLDSITLFFGSEPTEEYPQGQDHSEMLLDVLSENEAKLLVSFCIREAKKRIVETVTKYSKEFGAWALYKISY